VSAGGRNGAVDASDAGKPRAAPRIAIVIPTFNCAAHLPAALASIAAQTWKPTRTIVVDDGSTDGTAALLAERAARGELTVITIANAGPAAARNAGVRAADEEFVAFLDADDTLEPDALRVMAEALLASPDAGFCITDVARVYADHVEARNGRPPEGDLRLAILRANFVEGGGLFRRSVLLEAGLFDESLRIFEDWELYIRIIDGGVRPVYVAGTWYRYVVRPNSLTRDLTAMTRCKEVVLRRHHKRLADAGEPRMRVVYADQMWWLARHCAYHVRRRGAALRFLLEALRYDPDPRRLVHAARTRLRRTA
jgi:glycosyltransferase involved in cell wall biosynthesis